MKLETENLDQKVRKNAAGKFVKLKHGFVHYELEGSLGAPLVVLIHGLTSPFFVWDFAFSGLKKAGLRVLRYDLYGRGYSDRPKVKYDENLFVQQLFELLDKLCINHEKISIAGVSMGSSIAVLFAEKHRKMINKLSLIAPAGFPLPKSFSRQLLHIPVLNKILFKLIANKMFLKSLPNAFYSLENFDKYKEKFLKQLRYKGYQQAIFSTLLNFPLEKLANSYQGISDLNIPVQII